MLTSEVETREVHGISSAELQRIRDFMQGAIYVLNQLRPDGWFAVRNLVGGANSDWTGTPLMALYDKHILGKPEAEAELEAGKDLGWIVLRLLKDDLRTYHTRKEYTREYQWVATVPTLQEAGA